MTRYLKGATGFMYVYTVKGFLPLLIHPLLHVSTLCVWGGEGTERERTFKFHSLSKFHLYNPALSTIVPMSYITSSDFIHGITEFCIF